MAGMGQLREALATAPGWFWALVVGTLVGQFVIWRAGKPARERLRRLAGKAKRGDDRAH